MKIKTSDHLKSLVSQNKKDFQMSGLFCSNDDLWAR